jgi:hypothetical protein
MLKFPTGAEFLSDQARGSFKLPNVAEFWTDQTSAGSSNFTPISGF